jgi:hypothetical protein
LGNITFEFAYFFFVSVCLLFGRIAVERWFAVRYPLAVLVHSLIDVLFSVENELDFRTDLKAKQRQLSGLEVASLCIKEYLPRQLSVGDLNTNLWWRQMTQQVANALNDKKRWILTPKMDTQEWLSRSLASTLVCVLSGNWDALEK